MGAGALWPLCEGLLRGGLCRRRLCDPGVYESLDRRLREGRPQRRDGSISKCKRRYGGEELTSVAPGNSSPGSRLVRGRQGLLSRLPAVSTPSARAACVPHRVRRESENHEETFEARLTQLPSSPRRLGLSRAIPNLSVIFSRSSSVRPLKFVSSCETSLPSWWPVGGFV